MAPEDGGPLPAPHSLPVSYENTLLPSEIPSTGRNYYTTNDPQITGIKEMKRRYEADPRLATVDPRQRHMKPPRWSRLRPRKHLEQIFYKYDEYSVGPPPPREIVIRGLSPLTSPATVLQQCRMHGKVEASELKMDPQTGESIGIMWISFASSTQSDAHESAQQAKRTLDGQRVGPSLVHIVLDHERKNYVQQYRALLKERYERKHEERVKARERERQQRRERHDQEQKMAKEARNALPRSSRWGQKRDDVSPTIARHLVALGHPYIHIPRMPSSALDARDIRTHFSSFSPVFVEQDIHGWYVGFDRHDSALRCKLVLETGTLHGYRLHFEVREPKELKISSSANEASSSLKAPKQDPPPSKKIWTPDELIQEATSRILSNFTKMFLRDIKTRTVIPHVSQYLRADGKGGMIIANQKAQLMARSATQAGYIPSFRRLDAIPKRVTVQSAASRNLPSPTHSSQQLDPFAAGLVQDDEELYYLGQVLQNAPLAPSEREEPAHEAGSARAQGFYRIPAAEKAVHLADRNRAAVTETTTTHSLASARNNRADTRRLALDIEQSRRETQADTDLLHINQLQTRKKQLRFAKSPIHDWGLYAMELIPAGDMVIEYVGEIVRQQVADHREKMYERAGNFSTYLFRVDDDIVIDATRKGNIARLMNVRLFLFNPFLALLYAKLHGKNPHGTG